jgi:cob(I)alamin adenosyltransferase
VPKLTKIYTRGGDDGTTGLGGGQRVKKHSPRIEAAGAIDELSSAIGLAVACGADPELTRGLREVQNELFHLGADLSVLAEDRERMPVPQIEQRHIDALEQLMDRLNAELGPLENFILPGGSECAAKLHVARAVCRRAERTVVALAEREKVNPLIVGYLNRLSDALFTMARKENRRLGVPDVTWDSRK